MPVITGEDWSDKRNAESSKRSSHDCLWCVD